MKKIVTVMVITLLLAVILSGCTIINVIFDLDELPVPTDIQFDEESGFLSWSEVKKAESYDVSLTIDGVEKVIHCDECSLQFDQSMVGVMTVKVRANKGTKSSEYSEPLSITYVAPLNVDGTSISANYIDGSLIIDWADVNYADGYRLKYTYNGDTVELTVKVSEYTITDYISAKTCDIEIYALGSGNYRNGKTATYRFLGVADYNDIKGTVSIDMIEGVDAVFTIQGITKATLDKSKDITSICDLTGNFTIPFESLESIEVGEHTLALTDSDETVVYKLILADTRAPKVIVGDYVKHGGDLIATIKAYRNVINGLYLDGVAVGDDICLVDQISITFYSTYLDTLPEGKHSFELRYTVKDSGETKSILVDFEISTKVATIDKLSYDYNGNDISITIFTHGDEVTMVKLGGNVLDKEYSTAANKLVIYKSAFESGSGNLEIITAKGGNFTIKINYLVDGFSPDQKLYVFDKSEPNNLTISGKTKAETLTVFGNGLTPSGYSFSNGNLIMNKSYLSSLDSGIYNYSVYVDDIISSYSVKVYASDGDIHNVRLNYDISSVDEYITFDCDCVDDEHTYILDGQSAVSCTNMELVDVNRTAEHTLIINCPTLGKSAEYTISPTLDMNSYLTSFYSVNGIEMDRYIDSPLEFATLMQYVANGGDGVSVSDEYPNGYLTVEVYFSDSFSAYVKATSSYFQDAIDSIETATSCRYSLQSLGHKVTITAMFNYHPEEMLSSGMTEQTLLDNTISLSKSSRSDDYNDFAINSFELTEQITTLAELEYLTYGVKPTFVSGTKAEAVYNKALDILRTYVDDDMSDLQKVTVIYDYLVSHITYDENALSLFNVRSNIQGRSLSDMKAVINKAIASNSELSGVLSPYLKYTDSEELYKAFSNEVSSLASFNIYGAMVNNIAVCDGISSAFKLLCNIEGIECIKVSGLGVSSTRSENHAWNKVKIDGKWYVADATWGRSSGYVNHRYFLIDELDASESHKENYDSNYNSVVEIAADGNIEFFTANYSNVYYASSRSELKSIVSQLKAKGITQIEIKLDYDFTDLESEVKSLNVKCSYFKYDYILKIILK